MPKAIKTKFVNNINCFTGESMKKKPAYVDLASLTIANDPLPSTKIITGHKYDPVFDKLKPGQCLQCESKDVGRLSNGLRSYLVRKNIEGKVRATENYGDGKGRVWLLAA